LAPLEQERLGQIKNNINLLKGQERDKESLVSGLARIEARIADILQNWRGEPGDATSRNDLAEMRALAQRIADCLELYLYQPRPKKLLSRRRFAKKMNKLNKSLQKLAERPPNAAEQVGSQPELHVDETPKGVANATRKLLELLNTTGTDPEMLMVIAVVGFSGSGKTTLANEVYKRTSREGDHGFPLRARINSAQYNNNQTELLLRKIIQEFWPNAVEATGQLSLWDLKTYIKEHLQGVRYILRHLCSCLPSYYTIINSATLYLVFWIGSRYHTTFFSLTSIYKFKNDHSDLLTKINLLVQLHLIF
jgi:ATPase subunit of ABC transporter with duplicated ATPase domains